MRKKSAANVVAFPSAAAPQKAPPVTLSPEVLEATVELLEGAGTMAAHMQEHLAMVLKLLAASGMSSQPGKGKAEVSRLPH